MSFPADRVVLYTCGNCLRGFAAHPDYVPTARGVAVCRNCVQQANEIRVGMGMPALQVHPLAYEPEEIGW